MTHHKWEVPRDNLPTDADGFVFRICQLSIIRLDSLAVNLIGPAGIVLEDGDTLGEVFIQRHLRQG